MYPDRCCTPLRTPFVQQCLYVNYRITSKANLHQRQVGFSETNLPPTIRDACFAALNLNISYIWIDCLCIVQDDAEEWALEAPKMGSVYNGSIVTIAATSTASGHGGLFNTQSSSILPRDPDREITLGGRLTSGSSSILRITRPHASKTETDAWAVQIVGAPLMRRSWVCQERLSSPRIIHYTSAQLFWECEHCTLSEDNAIVSSGKLATDTRPRLLLLSLYQSRVSEEWHISPAEYSRLHPLNQWYGDFIDNQYSRCSLTFQHDKLIAVSGLARLIHDKTSIPYFAGHWFPDERWFLSSLCWHRDSAGAKTREYRAPSWSWASQDSAVTFYGLGASAASLHSRVVHVSVEPAATFGSLYAGETVLEGPLLLIELRYIPYTNMWDAPSYANGFSTGPEFHYLDDDIEPPSDMVSHALALTSKDAYGNPWRLVYFLILEEVIEPAEILTMKRVGFGITSTDSEWERELLGAPATRVRTI